MSSGAITFYESDITNFINNSTSSNQSVYNFKNHIMYYLKKEYNCVLLKGLNSNERHLIYKQMVYPLKFEKVKENENVTIRIFVKKEDQEEEDKEENPEENPEEDPDDESYNFPTEEGYEESKEELELEYNNEKINREYLQLILKIQNKNINKLEIIDREYIQLILKIQNKTINKLEIIEINTNKIIRRTNMLIMIVIVGWCILFTYDPVKLIVINEK